MKILLPLLPATFLAGFLTGSKETKHGARTVEDLVDKHVTAYLQTSTVAVMIDSNGALIVRGVMPEAMVFHPHQPPPDISKRCRMSVETGAHEHATFVVCMEDDTLADALGVWSND